MPTTEQVGPAFILGLFVMQFQQWLKRFNWYASFVDKFPATDKYVHKSVAGLISLVSALGVTWTATGGLSTGGHIIIDYPSVAAMGSVLWNFTVTYVTQNYAYDSTRRPATMPHDKKVT